MRISDSRLDEVIGCSGSSRPVPDFEFTEFFWMAVELQELRKKCVDLRDSVDRANKDNWGMAIEHMVRTRKQLEARIDYLLKAIRLLDRITAGDEPATGFEPEEIQLIVERFVELQSEIASIRSDKA